MSPIVGDLFRSPTRDGAQVKAVKHVQTTKHLWRQFSIKLSQTNFFN